MKLLGILLIAAAAGPVAFGANKDMQELQRDVALVQDQVRMLNDKVTVMQTTLQTLMQQVLDNTKQSNVAILSMQDRINDAVKKQQEAVVGPVLGVGSKLDQMSEDFRAVHETVNDLNSRIGKLDAKIADLQNSINILKNPPAPPPASAVPEATPGAGPSAANIAPSGTAPATSGPPPGMQAEATYTNAYRDYVSGKYDLALDEFNTYLKYFPATQFAPNAQYYVGDIYFKRKDYDNAIQAFDAVLERFADGSKTADAQYMKGRALLAQGKRDAAAREYRDLISSHPDTDAAAKAKAGLKELGLSSSSKPRTRHR